MHACLRYMRNRPDQFNYPEAIRKELPIGSGKIESGHRYVIQECMKISGVWWKVENADSMLALRTMRANGLWGNYWDTYLNRTISPHFELTPFDSPKVDTLLTFTSNYNCSV